MSNPLRLSLRSCLTFPAVLLAFLVLGGCATKPIAPISPRYPWPVEAGAAIPADSPTILRGADEQRLSWEDVLDATDWAQVILVGEKHTDAIAHERQLALYQAILARGRATTLAMEFVERDEQVHVDDFLAGRIDEETFIERTGSADVPEQGKWVEYYQPLINAARDAGVPIVAANTPRRLARQARVDGYRSFKKLSPEDAALVVLPHSKPSRAELEAFLAESKEAAIEHGLSEKEAEKLTIRKTRPFLRSQEVWNATMADSILRTFERGDPAILLIVGGFHIENEGGTARELRHRNPNLRILTILLDPEPEEEAAGRADIIIKTTPENPEPTNPGKESE